MKFEFYKKAKKNWPVFLTVAILMSLFLFCMNDYNPFEDSSNSKAIFLSGPADGDTVKIFTSDTFTIGLLVPSYLESCSIETDSSRFGDSNFTKLSTSGQNQNKYLFRVSYYDTGWHKIRLISIRNTDTHNDNGKVIEERRLYAVSPLNSQKRVIGLMGDSIPLETDSVGDRDVIYHWDFGESVIETPRPVSKPVLHLNGTSGMGYLWVSDFSGKFSSPKVKFPYEILDHDGPEIIWKDENGIPYDTIKVSTHSFLFSVNIVDRGSNVVVNPTVNGWTFDSSYKTVYMKRLDSLDTIKSPLLLNVKATDYYSNKSQKNFYVIYDTVIKYSNSPKIKIEIPEKDNIVTALHSSIISGTLENPSGDSLILQVSLNGTIYNSCIVQGFSGKWQFTINLLDNANDIELAAYDNQGKKKADTIVTIIYDKNLKDTIKPSILNMTVDNNPVSDGKAFAENNNDSVRIAAYDNGTGIRSVIVNGDTLGKPYDTYFWMAKVNSSHDKSGTRNEIKITDQSGNSLDTFFYVIHDFLPQILFQPKPPLPLMIGSTYIDSIVAKDDDHDRIFYIKNDVPQNFIVDSLTGLIKWTPTINDTGNKMVTILINDQFRVVPFSFQIRVENPSNLSVPVKLKTNEKEFPVLVEANKDTITDTLKTIAGTGEPPFTFSVRLIPKDTILKVVNGVLKWTPSMSDTGYNQLKISVTDSFNRSDAIYPSFRVVPQDRGFTLKSNDSTLKDKSGVINLNHTPLPETLIVQIVDSLGINVDNFDVNIKSAGNTTKGVINSGFVKITLNPVALKEGFDTLVVTVKHGIGNQDSIREIVFYGTIPGKPQLISPLNNSTIKDTSVQLSWKCSDSDHDSLSYSLYIAGKDTLFSKNAIAEITDTVFKLKGLTRAETYFWKVVASDRKNKVPSDIGNFSTDPPSRVRFKTSITAFPFFLEALKDSLYLALEVTGSSGYPPFSYSADASGKYLQIDNGNFIKWKPLVQDTGSKVLTVTAKDSAGNFDTLKTVIRIVPPNRPCSLFVNSPDTINMSKLQSKIINCTVFDPDPVFAEQHTVKIIQRNTMRVEEVDSTCQFTITIDADSSSRVYDSLTLILTDRAGHSFTVQKIIYYGKPPFAPYNPSPSVNNMISDSIVNFSWAGGDPDGNDVTYDFYIGTSQNSLVKAGSVLNGTSFTDTVNKWGTTYYWKVVAKDRKGVTEGQIWSFLLSPDISKIIFNTSVTGANISSNVTDIPIAIRLDSTNTDFSQFDSINHDIRFKNSNGVELPVEIQDWNQANKTALIWVLMDIVKGNSTDQYITMFKGNGQNQSGGQAVFGSFSGVWHMRGNGTNESDVSGNNNNGNMINLDQSNIIDGMLGKAVQFNYTRYMDMGNSASLQISSRLTLETWIKISSSTALIEPIVTKGSESAYGLDVDNTQRKFQMTVVYNPGQKRTITSDSVYVVDRWYHLAGVFSGDSVSLYVNGKKQNSVPAFATQQISISSDPFRIGADASHPTYWLAGALDEVRVSALNRSPDWIKLSYESQRQGSSLLSFVKSRQ